MPVSTHTHALLCALSSSCYSSSLLCFPLFVPLSLLSPLAAASLWTVEPLCPTSERRERWREKGKEWCRDWRLMRGKVGNGLKEKRWYGDKGRGEQREADKEGECVLVRCYPVMSPSWQSPSWAQQSASVCVCVSVQAVCLCVNSTTNDMTRCHRGGVSGHCRWKTHAHTHRCPQLSECLRMKSINWYFSENILISNHSDYCPS